MDDFSTTNMKTDLLADPALEQDLLNSSFHSQDLNRSLELTHKLSHRSVDNFVMANSSEFIPATKQTKNLYDKSFPEYYNQHNYSNTSSTYPGNRSYYNGATNYIDNQRSDQDQYYSQDSRDQRPRVNII